MDSKKRKMLEKKAHNLKPVLMIGKNGLTDDVTAALDDALTHHELIKVKFIDFKDEKRNIMTSISEKTESDVISVIGNIGILFRQNRDPEKRKITGISFN